MFLLSLGFFLYCYLVRFGRSSDPGPLGQPIAIDAALFTAFALHHSVFARTRIKQLVYAVVPPALERAAYTWTASVLFILVCAWWQPVPGTVYSLPAPLALAGYATQLLGIAMTIRSASRLDVFDLAGVRAVTTGRPAGHPEGPVSKPLETAGLYAFVRHPIYLGWALFVFGAPHMTGTRFAFAAISTAYVAAAIPIEERTLRQSFGEDYRAYQRRVRWRMVPGVY